MKNGDIVALRSLGNVNNPQWLHSRARDNWVDLASTVESANTKWRVFEIGGGVIALKSVGDVESWLNGRTGDGWVNLSPNLGDTGTKWQVVEVGNGIVALKCLGDIEGPRWLDGRAENGTVRLAFQVDQSPAGTWWEVVR